MGDIWQGGHPLTELFAQFFQHRSTGAIQLYFKRSLYGRSLIDAADQNLCLRIFSIHLNLQASDQLVSLILVIREHECT